MFKNGTTGQVSCFIQVYSHVLVKLYSSVYACLQFNVNSSFIQVLVMFGGGAPVAACVPVCMYVCLYVCMYVRMYVRVGMCVWMYICMTACIYVWMYVCMYAFMYA